MMKQSFLYFSCSQCTVVLEECSSVLLRCVYRCSRSCKDGRRNNQGNAQEHSAYHDRRLCGDRAPASLSAGRRLHLVVDQKSPSPRKTASWNLAVPDFLGATGPCFQTTEQDLHIWDVMRWLLSWDTDGFHCDIWLVWHTLSCIVNQDADVEQIYECRPKPLCLTLCSLSIKYYIYSYFLILNFASTSGSF